ncbi:MAG: hypothetical protein RLY56_300, partial [Pseudomonadota bacterium]
MKKLQTTLLSMSATLFAIFNSASFASAAEADESLRRAISVLESTILVDGHNDLPMAIRQYAKAPGDVAAYDLRQPTEGDTDISRLREGRL